MIQALEDIVGIFCAYGLEFKDCDGFTHDWCTLLRALELAYRTSIHTSTNQTPAILEKGLNPKLPQDSLRKDLVEIHPTAARFKGMLGKTRNNEVSGMEDYFAYAKEKWDKSHATKISKWGIWCMYPPLTSITSKDVKSSKTPFQDLLLLRTSMEKMF
ncbi:hypothetical protein O181_102904 [Austropuccinia psidii MF-1]|uniref:Uncharacterized protein n=1 Tax=Austropuccinia psidii MF-1 TaxID=1389203 RepID=A0A9Q3JJF0_9BASI|nr:hypothetical protein [Austropuccinia psidii MF-1]